MSKFKDFDSFENDQVLDWCRRCIYHNEVKNRKSWYISENNELEFTFNYGNYEFFDEKSKKLPFSELLDSKHEVRLKVVMPNLETVKGLESVHYSSLVVLAPLKEFNEVIHADFLSVSSPSLVSIKNIAGGKLSVIGDTQFLTSLKDMHEEVNSFLIHDTKSFNTLQIGKKVKNLNKLSIHSRSLNHKIEKEIKTFLELEIRDEKFKFDVNLTRFERDSSPLFFAWLESNEPLEEWIKNHRGKIAAKRFGF